MIAQNPKKKVTFSDFPQQPQSRDFIETHSALKQQPSKKHKVVQVDNQIRPKLNKENTLAHLLASGELSEIRKHKILMKLCNTVQNNHRQGTVFGNIKPKNVYVFVNKDKAIHL